MGRSVDEQNSNHKLPHDELVQMVLRQLRGIWRIQAERVRETANSFARLRDHA